MDNKRQLGSRYEEWAAAYLINHGYMILEKNYRCKKGEIDIIATHEGCLVFIEVKYRKNSQFGDPAESVGIQKQRVLYHVANYYMVTHNISENQPCRFDVVAILGDEVQLISDAF